MSNSIKRNSQGIPPPLIDNTSLAHGDFVYRHATVPIFRRAEGALLYDCEDRAYIDVEAANGTAALGFDASILKEAVSRIEHLPISPSFCETDVRIKTATRIADLMYEATGLRGRVAFELGGAQGVELALKVVKLNTSKTQYITFEGGYHGRSVFTSQFSASHRYRSIMGDWRVPVIRLPYPDCEQCRFSQHRSTCALECVRYVETLSNAEFAGVISQSDQFDVAAFIIEPILNAGGIVKPEPKYIEAAVETFREKGALIVIDETFCGLFRTGKIWGFQHYNFLPDIVVIGKALTNGITPLSCVWAREPYMHPDQFPPGTHSATYINNVLALSVADCVLERFKSWSNIDKDIQQLEIALQSIIEEVVHRFNIAQSGYALGGLGRILLKENVAGEIVDLARCIAVNDPFEGIHGLILATTGMARNVIALNPPLNMDLKLIPFIHELLFRTFDCFERARQ